MQNFYQKFQQRAKSSRSQDLGQVQVATNLSHRDLLLLELRVVAIVVKRGCLKLSVGGVIVAVVFLLLLLPLLFASLRSSIVHAVFLAHRGVNDFREGVQQHHAALLAERSEVSEELCQDGGHQGVLGAVLVVEELND